MLRVIYKQLVVEVIQGNLLHERNPALELDYNCLFSSSKAIKNDFNRIWNKIIQKNNLDINIDKALSEIKNLVIYDIIDGSRSTLASKSIIDPRLEAVLYTLNFIHTLKALGAKKCIIMIHTSYNRKRGENDFKKILHAIKTGAPLIKKYAIENNIWCNCCVVNKNYELFDLLKDVTESTKKGDFCAYFLFDYNEEWAITPDGKEAITNLPNIDVVIRHTKFQISGGWIPEKLIHSVFLYSQNGSIYSNWNSDELVTLIALALLAKSLHAGELLQKTYISLDEINQRYECREKKLFNKVIKLREKSKKLFMMGSPIGVYQFYY
jgi:hypothetical protein